MIPLKEFQHISPPSISSTLCSHTWCQIGRVNFIPSISQTPTSTMQNLTSSDISFLLCTILSASSPLKQPAIPGLPPLRLTLKTSYGLHIELSPSPPSDVSISLANKPPLTPISKQIKSLESLLLLHPSPLPSPPSSPPPCQPPPQPSRILHLSPCFRTSTFLRHSSSSSSSSASKTNPKPTNESLLELHYGPAFYSAYLDWIDRAEALENNHLCSFYTRCEKATGDVDTRDELEEGERILWMVEGVLLAAWLALQGDVEGVEYTPWDRGSDREDGKTEEGYWLDKRSVSEGVKALLRDVGV